MKVIGNLQALVMRGVFSVVLLAFVAAVLAASEPYFHTFAAASGSGDGDTVPANATIDSTDHDGSGTDDEDGSGSAVATTEGNPTTEQITTEATTQSRSSTTTMSTTQAAIGSTDDEDITISSGSGSGSGVVNEVFTKAPGKSTASATDIYIDVSTTDSTLIIEGREFRTKSTPSKKISTRAPTEGFKTDTPKFVSNGVVADSETLATGETIQMSTEPIDSKTDDSTTEALVKASRFTTEVPNTEKREHEEGTAGLPRTTSTIQRPKPSRKPDVTTRKTHETTKNPHVLGRVGEKDDENFTLATEVIAGVVGCALLALLLIAFLMYRLKKRDEGSYLLDESNTYPVDYKKMHESDKEAFI